MPPQQSTLESPRDWRCNSNSWSGPGRQTPSSRSQRWQMPAGQYPRPQKLPQPLAIDRGNHLQPARTEKLARSEKLARARGGVGTDAPSRRYSTPIARPEPARWLAGGRMVGMGVRIETRVGGVVGDVPLGQPASHSNSDANGYQVRMLSLVANSLHIFPQTPPSRGPVRAQMLSDFPGPARWAEYN